jgi:glycosyltransferase involved in cell wall biosynthesis
VADPRPPRVLLIQTCLPDYRQRFVTELERRLGRDLLVAVGTDHFDGTSSSDVDGQSVSLAHRNVFLLGRRLLWQRDVVRSGIASSAVVIELNPRILSSWLILLIRRSLGRRTIAWGHSRGRAGGTALRNLMRRMSSAVIVYTETEREDLVATAPGMLVVAAPNAVYPAESMKPVEKGQSLVWVGRMVATKKPELAVRGFAAALDHLPAHCQLVMAGDGPLRPAVRQLVDRLELADRVRLPGHVPPDHMAEVFAGAAATICTGYVGLNMVQSLGFGVPVLYAIQEPHSPEIEAATPANSVRFASDDADALAAAMVSVFDGWTPDRPAIAERCRQTYSVEAMVDGFLAAVHGRPALSVVRSAG